MPADLSTLDVVENGYALWDIDFLYTELNIDLSNIEGWLVGFAVDLCANDVIFENGVYTNTPVPEPTTMLLLGTGLLGLAGLGRKKFFKK